MPVVEMLGHEGFDLGVFFHIEKEHLENGAEDSRSHNSI